MSPKEKVAVPILKKRKVTSVESYDRFVSKRGVPPVPPSVPVRPHDRTVETKVERGEVRQKPSVLRRILGEKRPKTDLELQADEIDEFVEAEEETEKEGKKSEGKKE